jgi:hypothetical protein
MVRKGWTGRRTDRVLWIDALCINQVDTDERNKEVQRMNLINENSTRVVSWLGPSKACSD